VGMRGPCGWWWVCEGHAGGGGPCEGHAGGGGYVRAMQVLVACEGRVGVGGYARAMRVVVGMRGPCRCWWHAETSTRTPDMIIKQYVILT
jgi:hypothetical protein